MLGRPVTKERKYRIPIEETKERHNKARMKWARNIREHLEIGNFYALNYRLGTEYTGSHKRWVPCELIQITNSLLIFENREDESKNNLHYTVSLADILTADVKLEEI